ncbi:MAG: hypothetical protein ABIK97_02975 [candidate division WOR-3 bacterium]
MSDSKEYWVQTYSSFHKKRLDSISLRIRWRRIDYPELVAEVIERGKCGKGLKIFHKI